MYLRSLTGTPYCGGYRMRHEHWVRFTWDVGSLPALDLSVPEHYAISDAQAADADELRAMVSRCFVLDPAWNASIDEVSPMVNGWLDRAVKSDDSTLLALRHGARIIGGVVVVADPAADNHLAPGPCVLLEYRNRGFGARLLAHALQRLRDAGMTEASALAKAGSPVAKFLYPKFGGVAARCEISPLLAA